MHTFLKFFIFLLISVSGLCQSIPTPKDHFGFSIGDNYQLANYSQTSAYFKKLDLASDRATMNTIGQTEEGRDQFMMVVTSPENHKLLSTYKEIAQKLARAENLSEEEAKKLASTGKAVVWIDGGLHATEVVGAHQLIEIAYQLCSRNDVETKFILDNVIVLIVHANPDGQELVSNWYMRNSDSSKRTISFLPKLYEKYAGHDNNRDFYMMNLKETQNMAKQLFIEWLPQIMYNHHQSGPPGTVVAGPPFRDPFNYVFDPLVMTSLDAVGAAMINRLIQEDKPGYTQRAGSPYSTWYNGGLRTTTYFHNMIGLLTEIIGSPTPSEIAVVPNRLIPSSANPYPITPRKWYFKNSIDYSVSLNYGVLMYAARHRDELLYNIYRMGKNSIVRGSKDNWTQYPSKTALIQDYFKKDQPPKPKEDNATPEGWGRNITNIATKYFDTVFKNPSFKDARAYVISAAQSDFATATRFVNALIRAGIEIQQASSTFAINGKMYPPGSYIVKCDQAFRPHILDLFEPQDHPNDFQYPGGPPIPPYDAAGWTLAYQMGIEFDRITEIISEPFTKLKIGEVLPLKGNIEIGKEKSGYLINCANNHSFSLVNALLKKELKVYRTPEEIAGFSKGSFYVPITTASTNLIKELAANLGADVKSIDTKPLSLTAIQPARIALWDAYGGSMPSGWMRWIFEQFNFNYNIIYAQDIDQGDLSSKYDVILFVEGAMPSLNPTDKKPTGPKPEDTPDEFKKTIGTLSLDTSIPALKKFMEDGGTILTIGNSTNLAYHLKLPIANALVETINGVQKNLPNEKFYIPGSVMQITIDATNPDAWGLKSTADVYFDESPVFSITPEAQSKGIVKPIAWFASDKTLRSGWAWGQSYLKNGVAGFDAQIGKGKLVGYGPEITFRAQTHGTFKLVFNQLYK